MKKRTTSVGLFTLLLAASMAFANKDIIPTVNYLLLEDEHKSLSTLERVLQVFENPDSSHILVAAHRGGRENDREDNAPGNSIANIDNALSNGFDLYESDIEILGDGTLVVFHDDFFEDLTNSTITDDLLDNATLEYAKSLFLTYVDGSVSEHRIPTLEEFLLAGKDKIMFKFDLKSGTIGGGTLRRIFDTVVATDTAQQVLIRGGASLLTTSADGGYDTNMIMRRYNSPPTIEEIITLTTDYDVRAISIPNGASDDVIDTANQAGLVVEVHELQGTDDATLLADANDNTTQGIRQFHSFKPGVLRAYLEANNHREF